MNIYVACPRGYDNAAVRTLRQEGLDITRCDLGNDFSYGALLSSLWSKRESFILVEGDIIPWPGACKALWDCSRQWCAYEYPQGRGQLGAALGCMKVSAQAIASHLTLPNSEYQWHSLHWNALDHIVLTQIASAIDDTLHIHTPPVAHARERD